MTEDFISSDKLLTSEEDHSLTYDDELSNNEYLIKRVDDIFTKNKPMKPTEEKQNEFAQVENFSINPEVNDLHIEDITEPFEKEKTFKKIKSENSDKFPKNKIIKILNELNLNQFKNIELFSKNTELILKMLLEDAIERCIKKGRKTLFIEDLEESIKELNLFFLYDLIEEEN